MNKNNKTPYSLLIALTAISLFLFSSVSPLHSIMNMQYNEWLYYLIGKGMVNGLVPYVDLIDHKGPYLFYFFAIANLIQYHHIGLYLVATFFYSLITIFSYKISYLIISNSDKAISNSINKMISIFTAFTVFILSSSYFMSFGTISAEVFTLPFTLMSYYLFLSFLYNESLNKKQIDSLLDELRYMSVYGICAGISFFIKANAVLAYVPIALYLFLFFIKRKEFKKLFLNFIVGLVSFAISLLPAVTYSLLTNSFYEMIEGAFTINILYTGTGMPSSSSVYESLIETIIEFKEFTILCILSIFALKYFLDSTNGTLGNKENNKTTLKQEKINTGTKKLKSSIMAFYILSLIFNIYSVYMSCRPYTNYLVYLLPYIIPLILFFANAFAFFLSTNEISMRQDSILATRKSIINNEPKKKTRAVVLTLLMSLILLNILSYSLTYELSTTNGVVQSNISSRILKIYNDSGYKKNNPKLLVIGYTPYLYEAFGTIPNEKYFATPVVSRKKYNKPYDALIDRINKADEEVIILTFSRSMLKDKDFQEEVYNALNSSYINVGTSKTFGQSAEVYVKNDR